MSQAGSLGGGGGGTTSPLTTKGDIYGYDTDNARIPVGADGLFLTADSGEALGVKWAAATTTPPKKVYFYAPKDLSALETNFAVLEKITGTNVKVMVRSFDDTTEEFVNESFEVPGDVSTTGSDTVTFRAYVMAKTAVASKNVKLTFGHLPLNDSEDYDQAYTDVSIDNQPIDSTQDDVTEITWTETLTNLGWSANDLVLFRFSREAATTTNLAGDMYLFSFSISIPRE
jgi:hypothetical protein